MSHFPKPKLLRRKHRVVQAATSPWVRGPGRSGWYQHQLLYLFCRSVTTGDIGTCANRVDMAESIDSRVWELRERLEMDLIHLGEEHHDGIRRKKEQHATEVRTANVSRACSLGESLQGQPQKTSSSLKR